MSLVLLAIAPTIALAFFFLGKDLHPEPGTLLAKAFFMGVGCIVPAIALGTIAEEATGAQAWTGFGGTAYQSFVVAGACEEFAKLLALRYTVWKRAEFDERMDGIVYAVMVSLGFATLENLMYVMEGGMGIGIARAVLSVPGHALFGVTMGFFFSLAKFTPHLTRRFVWLAWLVPALLHGTYNTIVFSLSLSENSWLTFGLAVSLLVFVVWLWRYALSRVRVHAAQDAVVIEAP